MGGEKIITISLFLTALGSPPHGRGKAEIAAALPCGLGITPAWAGKSVRSSGCAIRYRDHPRMGGEKRHNEPRKRNGGGSPPHGRGKVALPLLAKLYPGITPAWAGKRAGLALLLPRAGDHPRMGGEKSASSWRWISSRGSPPHGRGKDMKTQGVESNQRITPAWAGKSQPLVYVGQTHGDHPRMGGEKANTAIASTLFLGSPPHGRGKDSGPN